MPWLLLGLLPGLLISWIAGHKLLAITLFASSLIIGISYSPLFLNCLQAADSNRAFIKVMSHNIWKNNHNPKAAIELIRREQPDILLLQEIYIDVFQKFLKDLNHLYTDKPLQYEYIPEIKQAVISRFPIIPVSTNIEKGRAQIVRIETSFGPITVINVHIYKWPWYRRQRQIIELVTEDISKNYGPIVLGGDFNTNDQSVVSG